MAKMPAPQQAAMAVAAMTQDQAPVPAPAPAPEPGLAKVAPATVDYLVASQLHHDGQPYAPGATVSLAEVHAKPLLRAGVVLPLEVEPETDPKETDGTDEPPVDPASIAGMVGTAQDDPEQPQGGTAENPPA